MSAKNHQQDKDYKLDFSHYFIRIEWIELRKATEEGIMTKRKTQFLTAMTVLLLFPIIALISNFYQIVSTELENNNHFESMSHELAALKMDSDPDTYMQRYLNRLYGMLSVNSDIEAKKLFAIINESAGKEYAFLNYRLFGKDGKLIVNESDAKQRDYRFVVETIFDIIREKDFEKRKTMQEQHKTMIETFLGSVDMASIVHRTSELIPVTRKGKPARFYHNFFTSPDDASFNGGILVWYNIEDIDSEKVLKERIKALNASPQEKKLFFGSLRLSAENENVLLPNYYHGDSVSLRNTIKALRNKFLTSSQIAPKVNFSFKNITPDLVAYAFNQKKAPSPWATVLTVGWVFLVALLTIILPVVMKKIIPDLCDVRASINRHFYSLLVVLVFIFWVFLLSFGYLSIKDPVEAYFTALSSRKLISQARNLGDNMILAEKHLEDSFRQIFNEALPDFAPASVEMALQKFPLPYRPDKLFVLGKSGSALQRVYPDDDKYEAFGKHVLPYVAREAFYRYDDSESSLKNFSQALQKTANKAIHQSVSTKLSEIFGDGVYDVLEPFQSYDRLNKLDLFNEKVYIYVSLVGDAGASPKYFAVAMKDASKFADNYLVAQTAKTREIFDNLEDKIPVSPLIVLDSNGKVYPHNSAKYPFIQKVKNTIAGSPISLKFELFSKKLQTVALSLDSKTYRTAILTADLEELESMTSKLYLIWLLLGLQGGLITYMILSAILIVPVEED